MTHRALAQLDTPAAIVDMSRMQANIRRMQTRMNELGVRFRPHVKTSKCLSVVQAQLAAGAQGITVSTLKEAEQFFAAGIGDILYAVGMTPAKLPKVLALRRQGCDLKIIVDNPAAADAGPGGERRSPPGGQPPPTPMNCNSPRSSTSLCRTTGSSTSFPAPTSAIIWATNAKATPAAGLFRPTSWWAGC